MDAPSQYTPVAIGSTTDQLSIFQIPLAIGAPTQYTPLAIGPTTDQLSILHY